MVYIYLLGGVRVGTRDFRKHEPKKPKKGAKKAPKVSVLVEVAPVEVIKVKGKKKEEEE
ncbi:MAG TPA: hypothetical protein VJ565_04995 [Dehalococcoidia bacterium]|nr:hypothetical protein [Dehalococcoidia bacterium]